MFLIRSEGVPSSLESGWADRMLLRRGVPCIKDSMPGTGECGTCKTVRAVSWPSISGKSPYDTVSSSLLARKQQDGMADRSGAKQAGRDLLDSRLKGLPTRWTTRMSSPFKCRVLRDQAFTTQGLRVNCGSLVHF